jgi:Family of unknown function (DUF6064)
MLPFTRDQFLAVFVDYNETIWPLQLTAYLLGVLALALLVMRPGQRTDRIIAGVLVTMWVWTGIAYQAVFFAPINKAAYLFAALFVVEGVFLAYAGTVRHGLRFGFRPGPAVWVGVVFVAYAALVYPAISIMTGHTYPEMPVFGVTPCPVTIFTFGMLLLTTQPFSRWLLVIPFVWSLIGGSAAIVLDVQPDWLLLATGVISVSLLVFRDHRIPHRQSTA